MAETVVTALLRVLLVKFGQDGNDSNTGATGGTGGAAGAAGAALDGADYDFTGVINTSGSNITIKGAIIGGTQI